MGEYQVIGRHVPTDADPLPKLLRMRLFAPNEVVAKSRFWFFVKQQRNVKKATGQIVSVNRILEETPTVLKNFGIWMRYTSRSGVHNMYREYRDTSRVGAVAAKDLRRANSKQYARAGVKFPLAHRV